jgi:hypothetical protein
MPPPTSTPDVCPALSLGSLTVAGKSADWQIENGSPVELALNELTLDWPSENSQLKKVRLDGALIWNQGDNLPATDIQAGDWKGSPRVPAFADPVLRFEFAADAAVSGYDLLLELNLGCTLAGAD